LLLLPRRSVAPSKTTGFLGRHGWIRCAALTKLEADLNVPQASPAAKVDKRSWR
jgi:hypothetical protein